MALPTGSDESTPKTKNGIALPTGSDELAPMAWLFPQDQCSPCPRCPEAPEGNWVGRVRTIKKLDPPGGSNGIALSTGSDGMALG